jgi:hypothetical protein
MRFENSLNRLSFPDKPDGVLELAMERERKGIASFLQERDENSVIADAERAHVVADRSRSHGRARSIV